jgi:molybdopterin-containing oxidoreductase family molybdopterin binding subunit
VDRAVDGTDEQVITTTCAHNCGGRSLLRCTVRAGRLVRVEPGEHPDPAYQGACVRCLSLPGWLYADTRIEQPMRRTGPRGAGQFEPITWDEAFAEIAERLWSCIAEHGPEAVAFTRTSGASAYGNYSALQAALGATQLFGSVDMAVHMGLNAALGFRGLFDQAANEWTDRPAAKTIFVWGHNPAETSMTAFRWLLRARDAGSTLIVVDPRYSVTATHADWWVAPRPGTDLALTLGLLHCVIADDLLDTEFALARSCSPLLVWADTGRYVRAGELGAAGDRQADTDADAEVVWDAATASAAPARSALRPVLEVGVELAGRGAETVFARLRRELADFTPERVEEITGVAADDVRALARAYAVDTPTTLAYGYGVDRYLRGDLVTRAGAALVALTGNIGRPGASIGVASHGKGFAEAATHPQHPRRRGLAGSIPNSHVGQRPLDVRAVFSAGDYLNQRVADQNRALAWAGELDFLVVVDHFWQTSAQWADIVLPASTYLEGDAGEIVDLQVWGNAAYLKRAVVAPLHQSRPDRDIEAELMRRMGLGDVVPASPADRIRDRLGATDDPLFEGVTLAALEDAGGALRLNTAPKPQVQYADLEFGTHSGRIEYYVEDLIASGEALPIYRPDHEAAREHPRAARFPLVLIQSHVRQRAHSTFSHNDWLLPVWPGPVLELNPDDAATRGIADHDIVEVYNDRGHLTVEAIGNPDYPPGMCNVSEGWKQDQFVDGHLQSLVNGELNPAQEQEWLQSNLAFSDTRVEVRPRRSAGDGDE